MPTSEICKQEMLQLLVNRVFRICFCLVSGVSLFLRLPFVGSEEDVIGPPSYLPVYIPITARVVKMNVTDVKI